MSWNPRKRREVKVESFAIGQMEVTRGQYAIFVKETQRQPPAQGCYTFGIDSPAELRSARRSRVKPGIPRNDGGFRVARGLTPDEDARYRPQSQSSGRQ